MTKVRHRLKRDEFLPFAFTGAVVAALYFGLLTGLVVFADAPPQIALLAAYVSALIAHFTMNRHFVFGGDTTYAPHLTAQGVRYLVVALGSYLANALALETLPGLTGLHEVVVVLLTTCVVTVFTFLALRAWVFHASASPPDLAPRLFSGGR